MNFRNYIMYLYVLPMLVACKVPGCALSDRAKPSVEGGGRKGVIEQVKAEASAPRLPVLGKKRLAGWLQDLRPTPDGKVLTVLMHAKKPRVRGLPPPMRLGELWAVPAITGAAKRIARGVPNTPGGWLFSADSRWILMTHEWNPAVRAGALHVQDAHNLEKKPQRISGRVRYFVPSPKSTALAFVKDGVLHVGPLPTGPFRPVAEDVSTAEFSSDGQYVYFRRRYTAAGGLFQVKLAEARAAPRRLLDRVADYTILANGTHIVANARSRRGARTFQLYAIKTTSLARHKLTDDAVRFRVSPDGRFVAWIATGGAMLELGTLWVSQLFGTKPRKLAADVKDFRFSPNSKRLVFRKRYRELPLGGKRAKPGDSRVEKVGDLALLELSNGKLRTLQKMCPNYLFSPDGHALAYTARIEKPEVTRRLFLLKPKAAQAVALKDWLYEYFFRPESKALYFRADCIREGRACDIFQIAVDAAPGVLPRKEFEGVFSFKFSEDGNRAAMAYAHLTDQTFDLALRNMKTGERKTVDQYIEWPARLLGRDGAHVAYLVHEKHRPGLYVAKSP